VRGGVSPHGFAVVDGAVLAGRGSVEIPASSAASPEPGPRQVAFSFVAPPASLVGASRRHDERVSRRGSPSLNDGQLTFGGREVGGESGPACLKGEHLALGDCQLVA
jgi:hypothetical protein